MSNVNRKLETDLNKLIVAACSGNKRARNNIVSLVESNGVAPVREFIAGDLIEELEGLAIIWCLNLLLPDWYSAEIVSKENESKWVLSIYSPPPESVMKNNPSHDGKYMCIDSVTIEGMADWGTIKESPSWLHAVAGPFVETEGMTLYCVERGKDFIMCTVGGAYKFWTYDPTQQAEQHPVQ